MHWLGKYNTKLNYMKNFCPKNYFIMEKTPLYIYTFGD